MGPVTEPYEVIVTAGPHKGRTGNLIWFRWLGLVAEINAPALPGEPTRTLPGGFKPGRVWLHVWRWQIRRVVPLPKWPSAFACWRWG